MSKSDRQARMVSRSAPVHCGGPQRITSLLVQTSTSQLNLVINYKHHRIGSSLPSPNISRAAPRSYAHQSHVYAQNHHTMTRATGLYKYRTPAPTTWRCPRSQIRTRTRRPTKVCAACTPGKHAQAASQTLFMHQLGVIRVSLVTLQKSLKLIHKTNRFVFTGVHSFYT